MARQLIAGSIGTRKGITIRPDAGELEAIEQLAASWDCSLSQAAMRLVRIGLGSPERSQPSERATVIYAHLCDGRSRDEIHEFASASWGLNRKQTDQLVAEARALLERDADLARPAFLAEQLEQFHKMEAARARKAAAHQSSSTPVKSSSSC